MAESDRDPSRVHWMELFFDLIFVALVGQLAHGSAELRVRRRTDTPPSRRHEHA